MPHYHLFGGVLTSDLEFPELPLAAQAGEGWWLTTTAAAPASAPLTPLGTEAVMDGVSVVLSGSESRFRLAYDDTGTFDITDRGGRVVWHRPDGGVPNLDHVRADVLGRVMAVALQAAGLPTLHGSGVVLGGTALAFVAPKRHGKSTTAAALARAGAQLLSDDVLAVVPGERPRVLPGVPAVNLWRDSAGQLGRAPSEPGPGDAERKLRVDWEGFSARASTPAPLGAVYLLAPVPATAGAQITRERLTPVTAALALLGQAKIGALLGPSYAQRLLSDFARLAGRVPVYRLAIPRDLDRMDDLVRTIGTWHEDAPSAGAGGTAA